MAEGVRRGRRGRRRGYVFWMTAYHVGHGLFLKTSYTPYFDMMMMGQGRFLDGIMEFFLEYTYTI